MAEPQIRAHERRRERRNDRRIHVAARVHVAPREGGAGVHAQLVDVSAGGLRAHCPNPLMLRAGEPVDVEITVQDVVDARDPPLVNLRGRGVVVRVQSRPGSEESCDAALRFTGPLTLREPFAQMLLF